MFANDTKLNIKLCGAVTTLEGKHTIQRDPILRDLDGLERWACVNFLKFRKVKGKVLNLGWGSLKHKSRLGGERIESSPEEKDLGVFGQKAPYDPAMCTHSLESQRHPGLHPKNHSQQIEGGGSSPLFCSHET